MNKKDLIPVILLILMIPLWMFIDRTYFAPKYAVEPAPTAQTNAVGTEAESAGEAEFSEPVKDPEAEEKPVVSKAPEPDAEEMTAFLKNDIVELELTSLGGGIKSATMVAKDNDGTILYPEFDEKDSGPVTLDFTNSPALTYEGLTGIESWNSLHLKVSEDGRSAVLKRQLEDCIFERTITLGDDYLLNIKDRFIAPATDSCKLPAFRILTGRMQNPAGMKATKGVSILGVDSYTTAGGINYWGRKLTGFYDSRSFFSKIFSKYNGPDQIDLTPSEISGQAIDWVAAKNKFFVQILHPQGEEASMAVISSRDTGIQNLVPQDIAAALVYKPTTIDAGNELLLDYTYYIGPKQYSILKAAGNNMEGVMEFETIGFWSFMNWMMEPARKALLWTLNFFHGIFHNYGVAIILLTLLVRILFWPLTHKSTESMRRMQELQPEIKALQEKHKKDPQRLQQETMKLYREKKVNPMGGCLPMFVQIPVFIALFTVLRNAIELRYAGFLWIADLSAPENLFMGKIPVVGALNILPIVMAASMIFQQKMTSPSTAVTPEQQQQQKMMMFMMPIMMLFFFYSMPSGLVLYWTTSNLLMIAQTGIRNLRKKMKEA